MSTKLAKLVLFLVCCNFSGGQADNFDPFDIKRVHVICSEHFDAGFSSSTTEVMNRYFDQYFPEVAYRTDPEFITDASELGLRFMFQPYALSLYLDCPGIPDLHCPNATALESVKKALRRGSIWLNAFPDNSELSLLSPELIVASIEGVTGGISKAFGRAAPLTVSQRDVPGMPRSVIPILRSVGIQMISVGVNGGSAPPDVPSVFLWRDPVSSTDIVALWHPLGYGCTEENCNDVSQAVYVPGMDSVLVPWWEGDFHGPPAPSNLTHTMQSIMKSFPYADVFFSTFDDWLSEMLPDIRASLPVVVAEIGDSWIYGVSSDPLKTAQMRAMQRQLSKCLSSGLCSMEDSRINNFTRQFLKNAEHTWGKDVKTFLNDTQFQAVQTDPNFVDMVSSWREQRLWGLVYPLEALQDHELATLIQREFATLTPSATPPVPDDNPTRYKMLSLDASELLVLKAHDWDISFCKSTGSIVGLTHRGAAVLSSSKSGKGALGLLLYQQYSQSDYADFTASYNTVDEPWVPLDFGKPGMPVTEHADVTPVLTGLWQDITENSTVILAQLAFPPDLHESAGCPSVVWLRYSLAANSDDGNLQIGLTVEMRNKTATRLPEAMWLRFSSGAGSGFSWRMNKLNEWLDPRLVVNNGSRHLHAITEEGIKWSDRRASIQVMSRDAAVVGFGPPWAFPTPLSEAPDTTEAAFCLFDNLWGTNYVMWYPFDDDKYSHDENMLFAFTITASQPQQLVS